MKKLHWTGVFIELAIVVLGVFIGLQVNNWNQGRGTELGSAFQWCNSSLTFSARFKS